MNSVTIYKIVLNKTHISKIPAQVISNQGVCIYLYDVVMC